MIKNFAILYIDHNPKEIKSFTKLFNLAYKLFTAQTIDEGSKLLQKNNIHLLIIEQNMPEKTGLEFLESIYQKYPDMLKVLTGFNESKELLVKTINSGGIYRFLPKPWNQNEVTELIEEARKKKEKQKETQHVLEDLQYMCNRMNFLHEISQKISETKPLYKLLNEILENSKAIMNAEASSLLLYSPDDRKLHFKVATGSKGKLVSKYSVDIGVGIAGWVAKHRKPLLIKDCYSDPRFSPEYDRKTKFKTQSMICVPLIRKKHLLGVMQVLNKQGRSVFEESDLTIFETLASQCAIAIENANLIQVQIETEALERELETAWEIQEKLLPSSLPEFDDIQAAAKLIPAKMVGGDYYNIIKINDRKSLFFIADVSGKGIPAALIVSSIYSCLFTYLKINCKNLDLKELTTSMNKVLMEATTIDKYATCWFGLFDHKSRKLESVNAGHNPPYIFRNGNGKPQTLETGGIFLGCLEVPFELEQTQMQKDDVLVFFTDGVTEAWNNKEEDYAEFRLEKVIRDHTRDSAEQILNEIENDVKRHVGKAQQSDDFTCAVVKII